MQEIQEEALKIHEETDINLPQINSTEKRRVIASNLNFLKKAQSRAASQLNVHEQRSYKLRHRRDFDTTLTPVTQPLNRHPYIYERASNPDID